MDGDKRKRVRFYSTNDGGCIINLQRAEPILINFKGQSEGYDINDIIEFDQISHYMEAGIFLTAWSQIEVEKYKTFIPEFKSIVGRFFSSINDNNILTFYETLNKEYYKPFWKIFDNQHIYKKISPEKFNEILRRKPNLYIREILKYKNVVNRFKEPIRSFLLEYPGTTEILVSNHEKLYNETLYFPDNITREDKEGIIDAYIKSERVDINSLRLLVNVRNDKKQIFINDKLRFRIKKRLEEENERLFANSVMNTIELRLEFSSKYKEIVTVKEDNQTTQYYYNYDYIKENADSKSLFNNFVSLFGFLDILGRITLYSKSGEMGIFSIFGLQAKNFYSLSPCFSRKDYVSMYQIGAYERILLQLETGLEKIINEYVNEYIVSTYKIKDLLINISTENLPYLQKIRLLTPEFEYLLKQYKLWVEEGEVNQELLQITSEPVNVSKLPSLLHKKYFYANQISQSIKEISYNFFSDQSWLASVRPYNEKYNNFFDLLLYEKISKTDFEEYQIPALEYLLNQKYLLIDNNDFIAFNNLNQMIILKDLYYNGFSSYWHYPENFRLIIDEMENQKMIYFDNKLFSKQEASYFNYYLNKSEFTNGLDLRNRYTHGTQVAYDKKSEHQKNYYSMLRLLILAILKIEDDLYLSHLLNE